jgi:diaminopropionate ammonia-lyase
MPYGQEQRAIIDAAAVASARSVIANWPSYRPTPLRRLPALAHALGIAELLCKDESGRLGLGSFKALGGSYAVFLHVESSVARQIGRQPDSGAIFSGAHSDLTTPITVTSATAGNHGRSVAWGAKLCGCACVIYMHQNVSEGRADAVRALGARVVRTPGTYDDSVRRCAEDASRFGWQVISDTAYPGYETIPKQVMHGYAVLADEILRSIPKSPPTHIFIQGGCGGFAAAVYGRLWDAWGASHPRLILVEPITADCLFRSGAAGRLTVAPGSLKTVMGGLSCGEVSTVAWPILNAGAYAFLAIPDAWAIEAMIRLSRPLEGDPRIIAGEAGAAGVAGLLAALGSGACEALEIGPEARVLAIISEGATDPALYRTLIGTSSIT